MALQNQGLTTINPACTSRLICLHLRDIGVTHMVTIRCRRHNRHTQTIGGAIS